MGQTILKNKVGGLTVLLRLIKKSTAIKTNRSMKQNGEPRNRPT